MLRALPLALALLTALACSRSEAPKTSTAPPAPPVAAAPPAAAAFRVATIEIGNAVGADKQVTAASTQFSPSDTIYASVASDGSAPSVALTARWTYEDGQVVDETTRTIAPEGPARTEFHISKPSGWPAGKYRVEIEANGQPAGTRDFVVQ